MRPSLTNLKRAGALYGGVTLPLALVPDSGVSLALAIGGSGVAVLSYQYFKYAGRAL